MRGAEERTVTSRDLSFPSPWKGPRCCSCSPLLGPVHSAACSSLHVAMSLGSKMPSDPATPAHPPCTSSRAPCLREYISVHPFTQPDIWEAPLVHTLSSRLGGSSPESRWFEVLQPLTASAHFCRLRSCQPACLPLSLTCTGAAACWPPVPLTVPSPSVLCAAPQASSVKHGLTLALS